LRETDLSQHIGQMADWAPEFVGESVAQRAVQGTLSAMTESLWFQEQLELETPGKGFTDITARIAAVVERSRIQLGVCVVFIQHTSASLIIQENADPAVLSDLERWVSELAPEQRNWQHDDEGPDDMPAHARSALTKTSESIPISAGRLALGTWQALYLWEHRHRPHRRRLVVQVCGRL
jgi:secondary thiamine-phosphate synthase enzyme